MPSVFTDIEKLPKERRWFRTRIRRPIVERTGKKKRIASVPHLTGQHVAAAQRQASRSLHNFGEVVVEYLGLALVDEKRSLPVFHRMCHGVGS
jgi:hypothetical protein